MKMLKKEMKLSASLLSYFFILFGFMFFLPGYPILCGAFFSTLGIYQSFQTINQNNDILFSVLLPVSKKEVVKGKYLFVFFIELCTLVLMGIVTFIRMFLFSNNPVYLANALMNANLYALGMAFVIFGLFNFIFVGGFFKTAYKTGKPFIIHIVITFLVISLAEASHYFPGLGWLNAFGCDFLIRQFLLLLSGIILYILMTFISYRKSCLNFEKIDL